MGLGVVMTRDQVVSLYEEVKEIGLTRIRSDACGKAITRLLEASVEFLNERDQVALQSRVPGKKYVAWGSPRAPSRPVNLAFLTNGLDQVVADWKVWSDAGYDNDVFGDDFDRLSAMLYLVCLVPCLVFDLLNRGDRKRPATYFERVIGHVISGAIGIDPSNSQRFSVAGVRPSMTMDHLFTVPGNSPNIHLPVKMSTRERVVQVWSHQAMLDKAFGKGAYRGLMVLFAETKLDSQTLEVVEIAVPEQWVAYQSLLATMDRIYYLDVPVKYQELADQHPNLFNILPLASFFEEFRVQPKPAAQDLLI